MKMPNFFYLTFSAVLISLVCHSAKAEQWYEAFEASTIENVNVRTASNENAMPLSQLDTIENQSGFAKTADLREQMSAIKAMHIDMAAFHKQEQVPIFAAVYHEDQAVTAAPSWYDPHQDSGRIK
jgi:hypothetical protein